MTPEAQLPSLNDFYAGALALFAIILFAKFVTHRRHGGSRLDIVWIVGHIVCVAAAFVGVLACLIVLGWADSLPFGLHEQCARYIVGVLAGLAAFVLAADVASIAQAPKGKTRGTN